MSPVSRLLTCLVLLLSGGVGSVVVASESYTERAAELAVGGEITRQLKELHQQHQEAVKTHGLQHEEVRQSAALLGTLELLLGHPAEAAAMLGPIAGQLVDDEQDSRSLAAHLLNETGVACYQLARYADAHQWLTRSWNLRRTGLGETHVDTLQSLRNLAWAEESLGHQAESQRLFQQCHDGLVNVLETSNIAETTSSEAVLLIELRPHYPRIQIRLGAAAPNMPSDNVARQDRDDLKGWVAAQERLAVIQGLLNVDGSNAGEMAASHARLAFGPRHFKSFVVLANTRTYLNFRPDLTPAPFGPAHPVMATVLTRRALNDFSVQGSRSNFESDVLRDLQTAEKIRIEALGATHPQVADIHDARGVFLQSSGQLEAALIEFEQARRFREQHFTPGHVQIAQSLAALGVVQFARGEVAISRQGLEQARELFLKHLGPESHRTAAIASDLAAVAREQGDYALARSVLEDAVQVLLKTKGPQYHDTKAALSNLAVVQAELGDLESSARHFEGVLASEEPPFIKDQATVSLAVIQRLRGQPEAAGKLLTSLLERNVNHVDARIQLGAAYRDLGQLKQAEALLTSALLAQTDNLDKAHTLRSLGLLSLEQGDYATAQRHFEACLLTYRGQLGSTSRYTAEALRLLGTACLLSQKFALARQHLEEAISIKTRWVEEQLPYLAEADAIHFASSLGELDPLLTVSRLDPSFSIAEAYQAVWKVKSAATRAISARRAFRFSLPEGEKLIQELRTARKQLATFVRSRELRSPDWQPLRDENASEQPAMFGRPAMSRQEYEEQVRRLTLRKEEIERTLAQQDPEFQRESRGLSGMPEELRARLPKNVAVVDIVKTKAWRQASRRRIKAKPELIYEAFILRSTADAQHPGYARVELGPVEEIDQEISRWRSQFSESARARGITFETVTPEQQDQAASSQKLRALIWEKLSPELMGVEICLLIPDGKLAQIPLGALPGDQADSYLAEQMTFVIAGYGQQILSLLEAGPVATGDALLVGGVAFDAAMPESLHDEKTDVMTRAYRAPGDAGVRGSWGALPGTRQEVQLIQPFWNGTSHLLTGEAATKGALIQQLPRSRFVHLATHGFFSSEPVNSVLAVRGEGSTLNGLPLQRKTNDNYDLSALAEIIVGRNPLVLSGIVLAGANRPDEGVLTAEELVDLDLSGLELVTLSACETGLGASAGGEGVFGLQRAFALAGARSSLATLWKVDDAATTALMTEFYRNYWGGKKSRAESLRSAQLRMMNGELPVPSLKKGVRVSPYYWGAFVLSGDWR